MVSQMFDDGFPKVVVTGGDDGNTESSCEGGIIVDAGSSGDSGGLQHPGPDLLAVVLQLASAIGALTHALNKVRLVINCVVAKTWEGPLTDTPMTELNAVALVVVPWDVTVLRRLLLFEAAMNT